MCRSTTLFELAFLPEALKEWAGLDKSVRIQLQKKLEKLLTEPRVPSMKMRDLPDCYRIKLRKAGCRLIYHVSDQRITVTVLRVARRDKNQAYQGLQDRFGRIDR